MYEGNVATVVDEVVAELEHSMSLHGGFVSPHEGYAVLQESILEGPEHRFLHVDGVDAPSVPDKLGGR